MSQVKNTSAWLWNDERAAAATSTLDRFGQSTQTVSLAALDYLRLLLLAHWATVGTFVPTDVDARIRHHAWAEIDDATVLERACEIVDEIGRLPVTIVSERVVLAANGDTLSGHDGEWLAVRAGALGRALTLGADDLASRLASAIDEELAREERLFDEARDDFIRATNDHARAKRLLEIATTVAHNTGDLSRVVEQWPKGGRHDDLRARYARLGHPDAAASRQPTHPKSRSASFVSAGTLNKALMAQENHRFLPLRRPRVLRTSREFLLPFGPWFEAWGKKIATSPEMTDRDRAEIVEALLDIHQAREAELGCLRALAAIHENLRGGLEAVVPLLPARMRKDALRGRVRSELDVSETQRNARIASRLRSVVSE